MKLLATLTEEAQRCGMCGTADWEWSEDKFAYMPTVHVCEGCKLREAARDDAKDIDGGTIILVSGAAKEAALAEQREKYLASRRK